MVAQGVPNASRPFSKKLSQVSGRSRPSFVQDFSEFAWNPEMNDQRQEIPRQRSADLAGDARFRGGLGGE